MLTQEITIINVLGLHARAAAKFASLANQFASDISVKRGDRGVNGKSIMGLMMLAASKGTVITLEISGIDEADMCRALVALIENRFEEDE
ncbi:MAG: HPr family phosphocarrier protein [Gammaproteobacteria bacterium]|nr:HPr family phosphocarrier protein [Gammaproteobacteria bacterium]